MTPNTTVARGAVPCGQRTASTGGAEAKHMVAHMKHFNVSIMTQVRYKALFIKEIMG